MPPKPGDIVQVHRTPSLELCLWWDPHLEQSNQHVRVVLSGGKVCHVGEGVSRGPGGGGGGGLCLLMSVKVNVSFAPNT